MTGAAIAGFQSMSTGGDFLEGSAEYITDNWAQELAIGSLLYAVSLGVYAGAYRLASRKAGLCNANCFKEGTLVETEEGLKPIEQIEVGDKVLAYDEATGEQAYKPVLQLFCNTTKEWQYVYIEGETEPIISTPGHKYYLPENNARREDTRPYEHASYSELSEKWVSAYNLKKGDKVLFSDGKYGIIKETETVILSVPETTYNLEVADFHNYYVGENSVLVHNNNCGFGKYKNGMEMSEDEALDAAIDFLGDGYKEIKLPGDASRFVSRDAARQVRMNYDDLLGLHGPGPHINFELIKPKYKSIHIILKGG